jgi:hypothetical protein
MGEVRETVEGMLAALLVEQKAIEDSKPRQDSKRHGDGVRRDPVREEQHVAGAVMASRSQDDPGQVSIQDVITHPGHRRGIDPTGDGRAGTVQLLGVPIGLPDDQRTGQPHRSRGVVAARICQPVQRPTDRSSVDHGGLQGTGKASRGVPDGSDVNGGARCACQ